MFLQEAQGFGEFLLKERMKREVTQTVLGDGIYNPTIISRIEQGEFLPERLMRDRLMARLGESSYDYEIYVEIEDYAEWQVQNFLLCALDAVELKQAEQLLQQYEKQYKEKCVVSKQFYFIMLLQWLELKGAKKEECKAILEQAVRLTIPNIDTKALSDLALSVSELNLVLEYFKYQNPTNLHGIYQKLFWYMQQKKFDLESQALFYSKLSLYFCEYEWELFQRLKDKTKEIRLAKKILEICTKGIESGRNHKKAYFTYELLQMKQKILNFLLEQEDILSERQVSLYQEEERETKEFLEVLNKLYETYHIKKETNHYTVFYRKREVHCINQVIRARRKMFQICPEELEAERICSIKTIRRIEKGKSSVQKAVAQRLFQKFYLSTEMQRGFIVADNQEAIRLEEKYRVMVNQKEYVKAKEILEKLKTQISMTQRINQQYIEYEEVYLAYKTKELSQGEFIQQAIAILEYTMPLKIALKPLGVIQFSNGRKQQEEKYFTHMELTILYNIAQELEKEEKEQYFFILQQYLEGLEKEKTLPPILGTYGLIMSAIASHMGNKGNYEESSAINQKIIEQSLQIRHLECVEENIYSLMWNEEKRKGLPEKENLKRMLCMQDCIVLDIYNRDKSSENWFRNRIKSILDV